MVAYLPILDFNSNRSTCLCFLTPVNILRHLYDSSNSSKNAQRLYNTFPCLCINDFILPQGQILEVGNAFIRTRAEVSGVGAGSAGVAALAPWLIAHLYPSIAALPFHKSSDCRVSLCAGGPGFRTHPFLALHEHAAYETLQTASVQALMLLDSLVMKTLGAGCGGAFKTPHNLLLIQ